MDCLLLELSNLGISLDQLGLEVGNALGQLLNLNTQLSLAQLLLFHSDNAGLELLGSTGNEATLQGNQDGVGVTSSEPLSRAQSRVGSSSGGEDIVLELLRLTRHLEGDGLDVVTSDLQGAGNLARTNIQSSLGLEAHTQLRDGGLVVSDVVDVRLLIDNLEVTDVTVTLTSQEQQVGVVIVEGHQDTRGGIEVRLGNGDFQVAGIVQGISTIRGLGETNSEELVLLSQPAAAGSLDSGVSVGLSDDSVGTGINDAVLLVLTSGSKAASVAVPLNRLDDIGMSVDSQVGLSGLNIPNLDGEISGGSGNNVGGNRVELNSSDLALVTQQLLSGLSQVGSQTTLGDSPDASVTILRDGGENVVIEGVSINVQDGTLVSSNQRQIGGDLSLSIVRENGERTSTTSFPDKTSKLVAGLDLVGIPSSLGRLQVVIAELFLASSTKNVSVLG